MPSFCPRFMQYGNSHTVYLQQNNGWLTKISDKHDIDERHCKRCSSKNSSTKTKMVDGVCWVFQRNVGEMTTQEVYCDTSNATIQHSLKSVQHIELDNIVCACILICANKIAFKKNDFIIYEENDAVQTWSQSKTWQRAGQWGSYTVDE